MSWIDRALAKVRIINKRTYPRFFSEEGVMYRTSVTQIQTRTRTPEIISEPVRVRDPESELTPEPERVPGINPGPTPRTRTR